jgi:hypothetical protein
MNLLHLNLKTAIPMHMRGSSKVRPSKGNDEDDSKTWPQNGSDGDASKKDSSFGQKRDNEEDAQDGKQAQPRGQHNQAAVKGTNSTEEQSRRTAIAASGAASGGNDSLAFSSDDDYHSHKDQGKGRKTSEAGRYRREEARSTKATVSSLPRSSGCQPSDHGLKSKASILPERQLQRLPAEEKTQHVTMPLGAHFVGRDHPPAYAETDGEDSLIHLGVWQGAEIDVGTDDGGKVERGEAILCREGPDVVLGRGVNLPTTISEREISKPNPDIDSSANKQRDRGSFILDDKHKPSQPSTYGKLLHLEDVRAFDNDTESIDTRTLGIHIVDLNGKVSQGSFSSDFRMHTKTTAAHTQDKLVPGNYFTTPSSTLDENIATDMMTGKLKLRIVAKPRRTQSEKIGRPSSFYRAPEIQERVRSTDQEGIDQRVQGLGLVIANPDDHWTYWEPEDQTTDGKSDNKRPGWASDEMADDPKIIHYADRAMTMVVRRKKEVVKSVARVDDPALAIQQVLMSGGLLMRTGHDGLLRVTVEHVEAVRAKRRTERQGM